MAKKKNNTAPAATAPIRKVPDAISLVHSAESVALDIPLGMIDPDPNNIRRLIMAPPMPNFAPRDEDAKIQIATGTGEDVYGLVDSIAAVGLRDRLTVREIEGTDRYMVVDGHRRLSAMRLLMTAGKLDGDYPVKCEIVNYADAAAVHAEMLVAAVAREDVRPSDKARAVHHALKTHKVKPESLALSIGMSKSYIYGLGKIGGLPQEALDQWERGAKGATYADMQKVADLTPAQIAEWVECKKKGETYKFPEEPKTDAAGGGGGAGGDDDKVDPKQSAGPQGAREMPPESAFRRKILREALDAIKDLGVEGEALAWCAWLIAWDREKAFDAKGVFMKVAPKKAKKAAEAANANADK